MAFFTFDPTPIDGGTFNHNSDRFDWCALSPTKFLITYQQISPARLFVQVVNFSGTSAPTFGTAFVATSENISTMLPDLTAISSSKVFLAFNSSKDVPAPNSNLTVTGLVLDIDGSDVITTVGGPTFVVAAEFKDWSINYHAGTTAPFVLRILFESSSGNVQTLRINVDSITSAISPQAATNLSNSFDFNRFPQMLIQSASSDQLLAFGQETYIKRFGPGSNTSVDMNSPNFIDNSQVIAFMTDDIIIGAEDLSMKINDESVNKFTTLVNMFDATVHHAIRIDDEHVIFVEGRTTAGNSKAYIFRITSVGAQNYISNTNNPITITNSVINVAFNEGAHRNPLHYDGTSIIHFTGIVDNTGTNVIGFHIFSAT